MATFNANNLHSAPYPRCLSFKQPQTLGKFCFECKYFSLQQENEAAHILIPLTFGGSSWMHPVGEQEPCCLLGSSRDANEAQEEFEHHVYHVVRF